VRKRARGFRSVLLLAALALYTAAASSRATAQGWFLKNPGPASDDLYAVKFADAKSGWAVGAFGEIWHTTDGGSTWDFQTSPVNTDLYGVTFVGPSTGWAVGDYGTIVHTTDGGTTWTEQSTGRQTPTRW
jgi:photosystem II stability/assembly factor-like uncharacterized protein